MNKAKMLSIWIISVSLLVLVLGLSTIHAVDATVDDVLKGKTFSNSSATGLEGIRPPAPVERTGQILSYAAGDDGFHQKGVSRPDPRLSVKTNTVTDNLTGLMWQRSLNTQATNWWSAVTYCQELIILEVSRPPAIEYKDWRLPNIKEFLSLIDFTQHDPALPSGHPFTDIQTHSYWSSTTIERDSPPKRNWTIAFARGLVEPHARSDNEHMWCVRGGYGGVAY